jgi:predicted DNA-binding protein
MLWGNSKPEMEIQLTEQEHAQLQNVAERTGRSTEDVVREAINSFLEHEREFVEAVEKAWHRLTGANTSLTKK